ncbi:MAG: sigma-54-dependent Fis family transcriptional regulator [Burkholderiales bacterium]|nr:sigma-54-dependent Fis family transcriptional regulator [Burkholderiales bacterium]
MSKPLLQFPNPHEHALSIRAKALVFEDPKSQELLRRIDLVAPSRANVLIIGETGTGKELVARHVHALSEYRDGPFVAVNCGAFSETLVESELFGHDRGAFTGAVQSKPGWFEAANGGTLFLDEIGDLPLTMQVKLLRVLQEREVTRLGSRHAVPVDLRLVAATNVRLEEAVAAGRFREDLYYRLNVATLTLLPLRDRPGDILPLARHFLNLYTRRLGTERIAFSAAAERALEQHPWPGNIRQLENVIHHALLVCRGNSIQPADLHLAAPRVTDVASPMSPPAGAGRDPEAALRAALLDLFETDASDLYHRIEEAVVRTAFEYCHGNQLQTARLLGITRNVLRARLQKIGELQVSPSRLRVADDEQIPSLSPDSHLSASQGYA